jgi:diguanylate cyclase (GGDEF)-like protein
LGHRDSFDAFDRKLTDIDVISTYLPVHGESGNVEGVLEIYIDATPFVRAMNSQLVWLTVGVPALMLILFLAQLLLVRRASRIIDSQARQLVEANHELDERVEARTLELRASNTQLQQEVEERRKVEQQLDRLAHHDLLTGLPNRLMCVEALRASLTDAEQRGTRLALLFIDLDRFKDVNDALGHFTGDKLLKAVVVAMAAEVRPGDTLARFGGDEFVCILQNAPDDATIIDCADRLLSCFREPFAIDGNRLYLSASIGICRTPEDGNSVEALLRNADIAMYKAKAAGHNRFQHYTQEMSAAAEERLRLEERLRMAIETEAIDAYYQPKVAAGKGHLVGAEALARWHDDILGQVSPGRFIQIAEETGLIIPLGALILDKVCRQIKAWRDSGFEVPRVSVNVSVKQFEPGDFPEQLETVLQKHGLPPSCLELEITESVIMAAEDAIGMLERIRNLGVRLAIDDFGTGYSSLVYLKQLPVEVLKIDRAFITSIGRSPSDEAIIRTVITLAASLGLSTVAEGVEEAEQAAFLCNAGCDTIQGYYYGRPLPASEFRAQWEAARA